jgi:hypothetical protein
VNLQYRVRVADNFEYFEMVCLECSATFSFGQLKDGSGLFPKRKGQDGAELPNRGWKVWRALPPASGQWKTKVE